MTYKELLINKDKVVMASVDLICIVGDVDEAIALNQVGYWLEKYRELEHGQEQGRHFRDGRHWVYNSYRNWHEENFPFWSEQKIQRVFKSLEDKGLLLTANYNMVRMDRTKWYSIDYGRLQEMADDYESRKTQPSPENEKSSPENEEPSPGDEKPSFNIEQSSFKNERPIPEDTTYNTTGDTAGYKYTLSGRPDDASDSTPENAPEESGKPKKPRSRTHPEEVRQIVEYFNRVCGTNYRYQSKATAEMINARLNEGYTVADFRTVIDKKHAEWHNDADQCRYLRPETLFRPSHFESYLNQLSAPGDGGGGISEECRRLYHSVIIE